MANTKQASSAKKDEDKIKVSNISKGDTSPISNVTDAKTTSTTLDGEAVLKKVIPTEPVVKASEMDPKTAELLVEEFTKTPVNPLIDVSEGLIINDDKEFLKPKSSPEGMANWLCGLFLNTQALVITLKEMKTYKTSSDHEITIAMTKLSVARDLIGKCIVNNGGKIPNFEK